MTEGVRNRTRRPHCDCGLHSATLPLDSDEHSALASVADGCKWEQHVSVRLSASSGRLARCSTGATDARGRSRRRSTTPTRLNHSDSGSDWKCEHNSGHSENRCHEAQTRHRNSHSTRCRSILSCRSRRAFVCHPFAAARLSFVCFSCECDRRSTVSEPAACTVAIACGNRLHCNSRQPTLRATFRRCSGNCKSRYGCPSFARRRFCSCCLGCTSSRFPFVATRIDSAAPSCSRCGQSSRPFRSRSAASFDNRSRSSCGCDERASQQRWCESACTNGFAAA